MTPTTPKTLPLPNNTLPTPPVPQFAIFNGSEEITEAMYKEVLAFAAHVQELEKQKNRPSEPGR